MQNGSPPSHSNVSPKFYHSVHVHGVDHQIWDFQKIFIRKIRQAIFLGQCAYDLLSYVHSGIKIFLIKLGLML